MTLIELNQGLELFRLKPLVVITLFLVTYAAVKDLKHREIPDWISVSLLSVGFATLLGLLVSDLVKALTMHDLSLLVFKPLIVWFSGFASFAVIGLVLMYTGQWGGGDFKLFASLGSVVGFNLFSIINSLWLQYLVLLVMSGGVLGFLGLIFMIFKCEALQKIVSKNFKKRKSRLVLTILLLGFLTVLTISIALKFLLPVWVYLIALSSVWVYYVSKIVEKHCMIRSVPVKDLTIGDWLAEPVKLEGKVLLKPSNLGLSEQDLKLLQKHKQKLKRVKIKQGLPFVPALWLATLVLALFTLLDFNISKLLQLV
ncbi:prepilin peptidase [Candidatus Woesearchaeota archaeon]|nr:prepilin peptidase [Candidatus Woesearchaeota archaeon]